MPLVDIPEEEIVDLYVADSPDEEETEDEDQEDVTDQDEDSDDDESEDNEEDSDEEEDDDPEKTEDEEDEEDDDNSSDEPDTDDGTFTFKYQGREVTKKLTKEEVVQELSKAHDYTQKTQDIANFRRLVEQLEDATGYNLKTIVEFYAEGKKPEAGQDKQTQAKTAEAQRKELVLEIQNEVIDLLSNEKYRGLDPVELIERAGDIGTRNFKYVADQMLNDPQKKEEAKIETPAEIEARIRKEIEDERKKKIKEKKRAEAAKLDGGSSANVDVAEITKTGKEGVEEFMNSNKEFTLVAK
jgi:hypothetical protein